MSLDLYRPKYGSTLEHAVIRALVDYMARNGWQPTHASDGEEIHERDDKAALPWVMDIVFSVDESAVRFTKSVSPNCQCSHDVVIILGNEWYCTISDWRYSEGDADGFDALMDKFTEQLEDAPVSLVIA
jgi:hypothetical protein